MRIPSDCQKKRSTKKKEKKMGEAWVDVDDKRAYAVSVFDDGNERYARYANVWRVERTWKGKSAIRNVGDASVFLGSISTWKLRPL